MHMTPPRNPNRSNDHSNVTLRRCANCSTLEIREKVSQDCIRELIARFAQQELQLAALKHRVREKAKPVRTDEQFKDLMRKINVLIDMHNPLKKHVSDISCVLLLQNLFEDDEKAGVVLDYFLRSLSASYPVDFVYKWREK
jgi:hypothetical protein